MSEETTGPLAAGLGAVLAQLDPPGQLHVAAWCSEDGADRILWQARAPVPAASTIKVPILLAALGEVAAGRMALDRPIAIPERRVAGSGVLQALPGVHELTLADLLTLMIIVSDNTATNAVINLIGMERVNAWCTEIGLTTTVLRRFMMDTVARRQGVENTTSAFDQASCLQTLAGQHLLTHELRDFAVATLSQQQFNDDLPSLLPDEVVLAHKTGGLPDVRHDVGIVTGTDDRRAVVAVLISGLRDPVARREAGAIIGTIGAATWRVLTTRT